jgi:hypothetical protein
MAEIPDVKNVSQAVAMERASLPGTVKNIGCYIY